MNRQSFFAQFGKVFSKNDILKISWAYWIAKREHQNQKRDDGKRYFEHCRRVANLSFLHAQIMPPQHPTAKEVIVALLHDCVEDQFPPPYLIQTLFGEEIASGVDTLSKITPVFDESMGKIVEKKKKDLRDYYAKIAYSEVWLRQIKLWDRFDNLSDMKVWPEARKAKYRKETWEFIMPIALNTDLIISKKLEELLR